MRPTPLAVAPTGLLASPIPAAPVPALLVALLLALPALAVRPAPAAAQTVSGTVGEAATGRFLEAAEVAIIGPDDVIKARTLTGSGGRFSIQAPGAGSWVLSFQRIGFGTLVSEPFNLGAGEWVVVQVSLAEEAMPLEPIVVTGRRSIRSPEVQRFYARKDDALRSGFGHFVARDDIDRLSPQRPTDIIRTIPGIRVVRGASGRGEGVRMAGGCIPAIYIDGMPLNRMNRTDSLDDFVTVLDIEGIEVYRGATSQVGSYHDPSGCGLVLVWTRGGYRDPDGGSTWKMVLGTLGVLGVLFWFIN